MGSSPSRRKRPTRPNRRVRATTRFARRGHGVLVVTLAACLAPAPRACARDGMVVIQFDDGRLNHYTHAFPILQRHGLRGTFGVITGQLGHRSFSMTPEMVVEMARAGHEIHDHTINHDPAFWGDTLNAALWGDSIRASIRILHALGIVPQAWNQPGGPGEGFSRALRDTLAAYYGYAAGRVGLDWRRTFNFHWNLVDDPMSLGRGGVYSWGYNAAGVRVRREAGRTDAHPGSASAELRAMIRRIADGYAQGLTVVPVFHNVLDEDSSAWALDSLCAFLVEGGFTVRTLSQAFHRDVLTAPYPGEQIPSPGFATDRDGNGVPDGWWGASTTGWLRDGARTTVFGPERGRTIVRMRVRADEPDDIRVVVATTRIVGPGPWHTPDDYVETVETHDVPVSPAWNEWADTFDVDARVDRVRLEFRGVSDSIQVDSLSFVHVPRVGVGVGTRVIAPARVRATPNPFDAATTLWYRRNAGERGATVVEVFDVAGRRVLRRVDRDDAPGDHAVRLDAARLAAGVYFARVRVGPRHVGAVRLVHVH